MACKGKGSKKAERKAKAVAKESNPLERRKIQNGFNNWI